MASLLCCVVLTVSPNEWPRLRTGTKARHVRVANLARRLHLPQLLVHGMHLLTSPVNISTAVYAVDTFRHHLVGTLQLLMNNILSCDADILTLLVVGNIACGSSSTMGLSSLVDRVTFELWLSVCLAGRPFAPSRGSHLEEVAKTLDLDNKMSTVQLFSSEESSKRGGMGLADDDTRSLCTSSMSSSFFETTERDNDRDFSGITIGLWRGGSYRTIMFCLLGPGFIPLNYSFHHQNHDPLKVVRCFFWVSTVVLSSTINKNDTSNAARGSFTAKKELSEKKWRRDLGQRRVVTRRRSSDSFRSKGRRRRRS
ncbi:uncharacterized protein HKW66_Vig0105210 [Vigna angularis]|uniref:Uncharacterized protein n=1 Tax=Phaseolus angularis TaxID=3914 RepID=A0A8T0KIV1_PHAAN|nr:uncharacterized protein HKW66_Vig0105210 [Vigna angularis]